ncbi:MAG: AMP-binding protein, partial [Haliea sp.]|nr:AMP-binding protein [Haliea sp.]
MMATMMHMPMTVRMIMEHGAAVFPDSRVGVFDGSETHWTPYSVVAQQAARLAGALKTLGIRPGDRVATFSWNNLAHMEAYLAAPSMGAIMHTVNIRLSAEQVAWVINHAEDRVVILDASLLELFLPVVPLLTTVEHILLVDGGERAIGHLPTSDYAQALAAQGSSFDWPELEETAAAAVCYTSGTTGNPKGVVYSHKTTFVHSLASRATDTFGINERDRILLLPPMFHANAWGLPYSGWLSGSDFIMPG